MVRPAVFSHVVIGMQVMLIASTAMASNPQVTEHADAIISQHHKGGMMRREQSQRLSPSSNRQESVILDEEARLLQSEGREGKGREGKGGRGYWEYSTEVPLSFANCYVKGAWNSYPWETGGVTVPSVGDIATCDVPFPGMGIPDDQLKSKKKCNSYTLNDYELLFTYELTESNFFPVGYEGDFRVFLDSTNASRSFLSYWISWPEDDPVTDAQKQLLQMTFQYYGYPPDAPATAEQNTAAAAAGNSAQAYRFAILLPNSFETCVPMMKWDAAPWTVDGDPEPSIGDKRHYTGALPGFGVPNDTVETTVACTAYEYTDYYYKHAYTITSSNFMPKDYVGAIEVTKDIANPSQVFVQYVASWPADAEVSAAVKSLLEMSVRYICYR